METVHRNGSVVGYIRRADYGFYIDKPIAYGYEKKYIIPCVLRPLWSCICSYISNPEGKITADWLKSGQYELESMGQRHTASIHLKSPFDADNSRVKVSHIHYGLVPL